MIPDSLIFSCCFPLPDFLPVFFHLSGLWPTLLLLMDDCHPELPDLFTDTTEAILVSQEALLAPPELYSQGQDMPFLCHLEHFFFSLYHFKFTIKIGYALNGNSCYHASTIHISCLWPAPLVLFTSQLPCFLYDSPRNYSLSAFSLRYLSTPHSAACFPLSPLLQLIHPFLRNNLLCQSLPLSSSMDSYFIATV